MRLTVSIFPKSDPKSRQRLAAVEMPFNDSKNQFAGETHDLSLTGEMPIKVGASCTEPGRYFSITVLQKGENIFNIAGSLENYAWAMLKLPSEVYLNIHIERNPLARTE